MPHELHISLYGDDANDGSKGAPMRTPQAAINRGGEGVTVICWPGDYGSFDPLVGVDGLTIRSKFPNTPARFGGDPAKHALCIRGKTAWGIRRVTLWNLEFHDAIDGLRPIASDVTVRGCKFHDLRGQGILWTAMNANLEQFGAGLLVKSCRFDRIGTTDGKDHGIYASGDEIVIQGCRFRDCSHGAGIQLSPAIKRANIIGNDIAGCRVGMYPRSADLSGMVLVGNKFGRNLHPDGKDKPPISTWENGQATWRDPNKFGFGNTWND